MVETWTHRALLVRQMDNGPHYEEVLLRKEGPLWETNGDEAYYVDDCTQQRRSPVYPEVSNLLITSIKPHVRCECGGLHKVPCDPVQKQIERLLARLAEAVALLRRIDRGTDCPICRGFLHEDGCALAKILRENPE
jgi:hypothetical protein